MKTPGGEARSDSEPGDRKNPTHKVSLEEAMFCQNSKVIYYLCEIMSKTIALYHIVFCTKSREMTIPMEYKIDLYRFIWNYIRQLNCKLYRIGGISNHIHLLINLHPSVSLATLVRDIKANSSGWMKKDERFKMFKGWAAEYFASSICPGEMEKVINYIRNQEDHHKVISENEEFGNLYIQAGLTYTPLELN